MKHLNNSFLVEYPPGLVDPECANLRVSVRIHWVSVRLSVRLCGPMWFLCEFMWFLCKFMCVSANSLGFCAISCVCMQNVVGCMDKFSCFRTHKSYRLFGLFGRLGRLGYTSGPLLYYIPTHPDLPLTPHSCPGGAYSNCICNLTR